MLVLLSTAKHSHKVMDNDTLLGGGGQVCQLLGCFEFNLCSNSPAARRLAEQMQDDTHMLGSHVGVPNGSCGLAGIPNSPYTSYPFESEQN